MYKVHLPIMLESESQAVYRERKKERKRKVDMVQRRATHWTSLPKCYGTPETIEHEDAGTEEA